MTSVSIFSTSAVDDTYNDKKPFSPAKKQQYLHKYNLIIECSRTCKCGYKMTTSRLTILVTKITNVNTKRVDFEAIFSDEAKERHNKRKKLSKYKLDV